MPRPTFRLFRRSCAATLRFLSRIRIRLHQRNRISGCIDSGNYPRRRTLHLSDCYVWILRRAVIRSAPQIMNRERDFLCDEAGLGNSVEKRRVSHVYGWECGCLRFCCTAANQRREENGDRPLTLRSNAKHVQPFSAAQVNLVSSDPEYPVQRTCTSRAEGSSKYRWPRSHGWTYSRRQRSIATRASS